MGFHDKAMFLDVAIGPSHRVIGLIYLYVSAFDSPTPTFPSEAVSAHACSAMTTAIPGRTVLALKTYRPDFAFVATVTTTTPVDGAMAGGCEPILGFAYND